MDFAPNPDHEEIRAGIRRLCADFDDDYWRERDETKTYPIEFHRAIAENGWLGINVPTEYGGAGLGLLRPRSSSRRSPRPAPG